MQTDANVYLFLLQLQINMLIQFSKRCCQYDYSFIDWVKTPTCVLPYGNTACTQPSEMLIEFILGIPCKRPKPSETRRIVSADLFLRGAHYGNPWLLKRRETQVRGAVGKADP